MWQLSVIPSQHSSTMSGKSYCCPRPKSLTGHVPLSLRIGVHPQLRRRLERAVARSDTTQRRKSQEQRPRRRSSIPPRLKHDCTTTMTHGVLSASGARNINDSPAASERATCMQSESHFRLSASSLGPTVTRDGDDRSRRLAGLLGKWSAAERAVHRSTH